MKSTLKAGVNDLSGESWNRVVNEINSKTLERYKTIESDVTSIENEKNALLTSIAIQQNEKRKSIILKNMLEDILIIYKRGLAPEDLPDYESAESYYTGYLMSIDPERGTR